jgi:hypothetical protein
MNKLDSGIIQLGKYRHFKGDIYTVIGTAIDSETLEHIVIYINDLTDIVYVRPLKMFMEKIDRFTLIK